MAESIRARPGTISGQPRRIPHTIQTKPMDPEAIVPPAANPVDEGPPLRIGLLLGIEFIRII